MLSGWRKFLIFNRYAREPIASVSPGHENLRKLAEALETSINYLQTGISVTVQIQEKKEIFDLEVFEFLCEKSGYSYATDVSDERYYHRNYDMNHGDFVLVNDEMMRDVLEEVSHYFGYLMHERAMTMADCFEKMKKNET